MSAIIQVENSECYDEGGGMKFSGEENMGNYYSSRSNAGIIGKGKIILGMIWKMGKNMG